MVVLDELRDCVPEVALTDWNDPIETFCLDRPYESLGVGVRVGRALGDQHHACGLGRTFVVSRMVISLIFLGQPSRVAPFLRPGLIRPPPTVRRARPNAATRLLTGDDQRSYMSRRSEKIAVRAGCAWESRRVGTIWEQLRLNTRENGGTGPIRKQDESTRSRTWRNLQNLDPRFKSGRRLQFQVHDSKRFTICGRPAHVPGR